MKKFIKKQDTVAPGLITDLNYTMNPGWLTFTNAFANRVGKLWKRFGWSNLFSGYVIPSDNPVCPEGNIPLSFSTSNLNACARPNILHIKEGSNGQIFILVHRMVNGQNALMKYTFGTLPTGAFLQGAVQIATFPQFCNYGSVKFIDTPDQTYILNAFNSTDKNGNPAGYVWKYNYGANIDLNRGGDIEPDQLYNIAIADYIPILGINSISTVSTSGGESLTQLQQDVASLQNQIKDYYFNIAQGRQPLGNITDLHAELADKLQQIAVVEASIASGPIGGLSTGTYSYVVLPVYNTNTIPGMRVFELGDTTLFDNYVAPQYMGVSFKANGGESTTITINPIYDVYITALQVYRTKCNGNPIGSNPNDGLYFMAQVDKPAITANPTDILSLGTKVNGLMVTDPGYDDADLGTKLSEVTYINQTPMFWNTFSGTVPPTQATDNGLDFPVNCGCYAQQRLFLGYENAVYMSQPPNGELGTGSDAIDGTLTLILPLANDTDNPITAIEEIFGYMFVFCKKTIYRLNPTGSAEVPYTVQFMTSSCGCDDVSSITIMSNMTGYFIFKNELYNINMYGQTKNLSGPIRSLLQQAISPIQVTRNDKWQYIKLMFQTVTGAMEFDYYVEQNIWTQEQGYRDIFIPTGNIDPTSKKQIVTLSKDAPRLTLMAYEYHPETDTEYGVTYDGDIVVRNSQFQDISAAGSVVAWQNYIYQGTMLPNTTYNTELSIVKAFIYDQRCQFNSLQLFGSGNVYISYCTDNSGNYSPERYLSLTRSGVETPLDVQGFGLNIKIRHADNAQIDIDYFAIKGTSAEKVDMLNVVKSSG